MNEGFAQIRGYLKTGQTELALSDKPDLAIRRPTLKGRRFLIDSHDKIKSQTAVFYCFFHKKGGDIFYGSASSSSASSMGLDLNLKPHSHHTTPQTNGKHQNKSFFHHQKFFIQITINNLWLKTSENPSKPKNAPKNNKKSAKPLSSLQMTRGNPPIKLQNNASHLLDAGTHINPLPMQLTGTKIA